MRPIIAPRPEGTLTDAGPLLALVNKKNEPEQNARCNAALKAIGVAFGDDVALSGGSHVLEQ